MELAFGETIAVGIVLGPILDFVVDMGVALEFDRHAASLQISSYQFKGN